MITRGTVRADGTSTALPAGVYDMASLGDSAVVSPELEAQLKRLYAAETPDSAATFKLEVMFRHGAHHNVNVRGILCAWTNGGFLNGGGDQIVYFCPHRRADGHGACLAPIDIRFHDSKVVVCTECRQVSKPRDLMGQLIADIPMERWATLLSKFFHRLNCSADIRVAVNRASLIAASEHERERDRRGEVYSQVSGQREWITYPLANIIKDTSSGAALETRIRAFLKASGDAMALTAGQIADKISEYRSKVEVYKHFASLLTANYMRSDSGAPELRLERADGAAVTEPHFSAVLDDINETLAKLRDDLEQWENLVFDETETRELESPKEEIKETKEKPHVATKTDRRDPRRAASK